MMPAQHLDHSTLLRSLLAILLLTTFLATSIARAEQKAVYGDYEIHYMAIPSTFLQPEIASTHDINRSRSTGVLNIAVQQRQADGTTRAVPAFVRGSISNDVQQRRELEFTQVTEGQAVYAIAPFWYSSGQTYVFQLEVQADPEQGPFPLRFSQAMYAE